MKRHTAWPSLGLLLALSSPVFAEDLPLERIKLPPGFHIDLYARNVGNARSLALGRDGVVFVGTRDAGKVYALVDGKGANHADRVITIAHGLQEPNGVAYRDGALYVAERSRILRYDDIEAQLAHPPEPVVIQGDYPTAPEHGWKFIAFGPDGMLYVPVGAPCNACNPSDSLFATITRLSSDGKAREIFARGIRNSVGFDWDPRTRALWFTDNGRDEMGDDKPDDELNHAPRADMDFGFPYCHAGDVPDPEFGDDRSCDEFTSPKVKLGAHVAALGMRFYTGSMFPQEYAGNIFIAERGSWNRTTPVGYRIVRVALEDDAVVIQDVFASGWLPEHPKRGNARAPSKEAWGRPVDVLVMPDGALLVSDDTANAVYRISYGDGR